MKINKELFERVEKVVSLLKEGYYNILHDYNIERWDDNTIGDKDSGCIGFPLCGNDLKVGCCFDESNKEEFMLLCPFANKPPKRGGCWWDCQLEMMNKEQQLSAILHKIDELENWLNNYQNIGGYYKYNLRGSKLG